MYTVLEKHNYEEPKCYISWIAIQYHQKKKKNPKHKFFSTIPVNPD